MQTNFTNIGSEYTRGKETKFQAEFDSLPWQDVPCNMAMAPAMGIKGLVREFKLPPPIRVAFAACSTADGPEFHPGILASEHKTKKQHFRVFALDTGDSVTPLAMQHLEPN